MAREDVRKDTAVPPPPEDGDKDQDKNQNDDKNVANYEALLQRVEGQSRLLGKLTSALEKIEKGATKPPEPPPEEKSLTERQKKLEMEWVQKTQKARDRAVKQTIAGALQKEGVQDPALAVRQANFLKSELSDRIAVNDDTDEVTVDDGGTQVPVEKFLHAYLQTDEGSWLMPQKRPPNDKGAARGFGVTQGVSADGKLRLTKEEFSKGKFSKAVADKIAKGEFELIVPEE